MKKLFVFFVITALSLIGFAFFLPIAKEIKDLPDNMVVTYADVEESNERNEFSSLISLSLPKDVIVDNNCDTTKTTLSVKLFNFITLKKIDVRLLNDNEVFVGGDTVGFNLFSEGVIYVGSNNVLTQGGSVEPSQASDLVEGDAILEIADQKIENIEDIDRIINSKDNEGKELSLKILRAGKEVESSIVPAFDVLSQKYKLGLWVRNNASGVGTLTYVRMSDFRFGAVGHPIVDSSIEENFLVGSGNIYKCRLLGIKKGEKNNPGEIRSSINLSDDAIGLADTNCKYGVYGNILNKSFIDATRTAHLGGRLSVKPGDAKIYCNIDNEGVKGYDIKILKANRQKAAEDKSMIIKVTDKELLEKTGGIIQGMSGSPIVQDGKIIGAVTHVFVDDPTRGYGIYVDWMIDN